MMMMEKRNISIDDAMREGRELREKYGLMPIGQYGYHQVKLDLWFLDNVRQENERRAALGLPELNETEIRSLYARGLALS